MQNDFPSRARCLTRRDVLALGGASLVGLAVYGTSSEVLVAEQKIAARIEQAPEKHPLLLALKMASESLAKVENVRDYTATFVKNERIRGELKSAKMELKLREKPKGVYLKFIEPHAGREVIYQPDKNGGKLQVHDTGLAALVGTLSLDPEGKLAMEENRHPVSQIGLKSMLEMLIDQWLKETRVKDVTVNFYPNARIGNLSCRVIEVSHSRPHSAVVHHMTRLYLNAETGLPVRIQNYDFPATSTAKALLVEDYYYMDVKTNVGLKDIDFDTSNPAYDF